MSVIDATLIKDGQKVVATLEQSGEMIESNGVLDANCIIQTANGPQKAIKTYPLGAGSSAKPEYVSELPEEGEEGVLYLVPSGETRQGYAIFQMFSWHEGEWIAIGAYDVGISPDGILYEENFNSSTNTLDVTTLGEDAKNSLSTIAGYNQNAAVQRLANVGGVMKWQTKSVVCDNFNQYNYLSPIITWPDTVNTVDLIMELTAFIPDTSEYPQNIIIFNPQGTSSSLFYGGYQHNPRGGFGYWNGSSNVWYQDVITETPATKWIRLTGTNGNLSVYCLADNNYTLETLPEIASWTYQGVCAETFGNSMTMQFSMNNAGAFKGVLRNWQIKANDSVVFDLRNDNSVNLANSNTQDYKTAMGIKITETWK